MTDNFAQPRFDDAVKGGESPPPINDVVLGGIEGVKQRLASKSDEVKIAALKDALKYGQQGLDLLFEMMLTGTGAVQREAYYLLYPEQTPTQLIAEESTNVAHQALDDRTPEDSHFLSSADAMPITPDELIQQPLASTAPVQEATKPKSWIKRLFGWRDSETD